MNLSRIALLFLTSCMSSCTPSIAEKEPTITLSHRWRGDSSILASNKPENIPQVTEIDNGPKKIFFWWEIYGDPLLNALELEALENSPTLEAAFMRLQEAFALLGFHESDLYPTVALSSGFSKKEIAKDLRSVTAVPVIGDNGITVDPKRGPKRAQLFDLSLILQYEVDLWGRLRSIQDSYRSLVHASFYDLQSIQLMLTHQVAKLYNAIRYYDLDLQSSTALLSSIEEMLELTEKKYETGIESLVPSITLYAQKKELEAEITEIKNGREKSIVALACFIGKDPASCTIPEYHSFWNHVTPPHLIPAQVLEQRPDIQKSAEEIKSALAQIKVAKTESLPTFSLTGGFGYNSTKANRLLAWKNHIWSLGSALSSALFDAGKRKNEVYRAVASYKVKAQQHIQICLQAIQEVEESLTRYSTTEEKLNAYIEQVESYQKRKNVEESRFHSGLSAYQEVLLAKKSELESVRARLQSQYQLQLASLDIIKSIGGSWIQPRLKQELMD